MDIKTIMLTKLNNILNPKFEYKFIFRLFLLGSALLGYQKILEFFNSFELKAGNVDLKIDYDGGFGFLNVFGCFLILLSCFFFYKIFVSNLKAIVFKTLKKASKTIKKLLDENERIFKSHGPNSSSIKIDGFRNESELKAWYSLRVDKILPNNEEIYSILTNLKVIDGNEEKIINKMKNHLEAFKRHLSDSNYDYTEHQFPISFKYLIHKYCNGGLLNDKYFEKYKILINNYLQDNQIIVTEKYFFGSVLVDKNPSDIDILAYCDFELDIEYYRKIKGLAIDFKRNTGKKLDITIFARTEKNRFVGFREEILDFKKF